PDIVMSSGAKRPRRRYCTLGGGGNQDRRQGNPVFPRSEFLRFRRISRMPVPVQESAGKDLPAGQAVAPAGASRGAVVRAICAHRHDLRGTSMPSALLSRRTLLLTGAPVLALGACALPKRS